MSIGEVSDLLNVSPGILRMWEREELVAPDRTKGAHRVYRDVHLKRLRKIARLFFEEKLNPPAIRRLLGEAQKPEIQENFVDKRLGERLRYIRKQKKLTLADVAKKSRLSSSFISALERGNTGVSLEALFRLAEALGTTIPSLKGSELPPAKRRFVAARGRQKFVTDDKTLIIEDLISKPAGMEAEITQIAPGGHSNGVWSHLGQEFVHILQGELSLWLEPDEFYRLKKGDTLYFHSHLQHRWENESQKKTIVLWVNAALPKDISVNSESQELGRKPKDSE